MNENLNLVEILKDCPEGTKLYSPIYGGVELVTVYQDNVLEYPIKIKISDNSTDRFSKDGKIYYGGECTLFPSRKERDWSQFKPKKPKFDPKTLCPFDKVLARDEESEYWECTFFSRIRGEEGIVYKYVTSNDRYKCCIPYNDDTKHLVGTKDKAPDYYRYWEE